MAMFDYDISVKTHVVFGMSYPEFANLNGIYAAVPKLRPNVYEIRCSKGSEAALRASEFNLKEFDVCGQLFIIRIIVDDRNI